MKKLMSLVGNRFAILAVFFILIGIVIITQLMSLQLVQGQYFNEMASTRILSTRIIEAPRGDILDRNGVPIAISKKAFSVLLLNTGLAAKDLNAMLLKVYGILEKNHDDINRTLETYISSNPFKYERMMQSLISNDKLVERANLQLGLDFKDNEIVTPQAIYNKFHLKYKIDPSYSLKDAFNLMCMRYETRLFKATDPAVLATDISRKSVAEIEERQDQLSGISTDTMPVRSYIDAKYIAHVLGYYRDDENKTGIESMMDGTLQGIDGLSRIDVNSNGQLVETIDSKPSVPGKNVILTIDMKLQKAAVKSLEKTIHDIKTKSNGKIHANNYSDVDSGAVVAMNPRNGEILALANYPSYDPNAFIAPKGDLEAQKQIVKWLTDSKKSPMLNRALGASYAPGSTYKLVVATAGLESGFIAPYSSNIYDPGSAIFDHIKRYCLEGGHGWLNLQRAIETSCNIYFYLLGVKTGIDTIDKWAKAFGLGELTNIDLPGEISGERSNRESKKKHYGDVEGVWGSLNTALSSIGQYLNRFTPVQMLRYAGALATNGTMVTPHVVQKIVDSKGESKQLKNYAKIDAKNKVPAKQSTFDTIREGMIKVIETGTAAESFKTYKYGEAYPAAGKTGTAQTEITRQSDNGDFMCYAPYSNPEIVVFVYLNHGVWGSWAADVGRDVLNKYFELKLDKGNPLAQVKEGPDVIK